MRPLTDTSFALREVAASGSLEKRGHLRIGAIQFGQGADVGLSAGHHTLWAKAQSSAGMGSHAAQ